MTDGLFRLLMVSAHRYSRDEHTRAKSSLHILNSAIALYVETVGPEAAKAAAMRALDLHSEVIR